MKNKVMHTPGPWEVNILADSTNVEAAHETIATNVANVNAPLIAAAPDLLYTLERIACHVPKSDPEGRRLVMEVIKRAKGWV